MSAATRCSRCGYASAAALPFCGYCYRRFPRRRHARRGGPLRTGPAAAETWARRRIEGATAASHPAVPAPDRYRSLVGLGVVAQLLLAAVGVIAVVVALTHLVLLGLTVEGDVVSDTLRADIGSWAQRIADDGVWVGVGGLVVTGAVFIWWGVFAYTNLPHLGIGERRWWTLWTVLGWLIPGANLFVPKLIMDDVWRASNPSLPVRPGPGWMHRRVGSVVHQWWLLWLGAPAVYVLVRAGAPATATSVVERRWSEAAAVLAALVLAGASRAARQVVAIVSLAQHQRAGILASHAALAARQPPRPLPAIRTPHPPPLPSLSERELREAITSW